MIELTSNLESECGRLDLQQVDDIYTGSEVNALTAPLPWRMLAYPRANSARNNMEAGQVRMVGFTFFQIKAL